MAETRTTRARAAQAAAVVETPPPKSNPLKRRRKDLEVTPIVSTPVDGLKPAQESLPIKLVDGQPLPTLSQPQPADLPSDEYQSIIQSGVLNASLKRSREVWLSGCHFKKYYTKPTAVKKLKERSKEDKDAIARDKLLLRSMIKIGDANFTVDPHIFTVSVYTIKDIAPPAPRYTPQYGSMFTYQSPHPPATPQYKPPVSQQPRPTPIPQKQSVAPSTPTPTPGAPTSAAAGVQAAPDPVIHMLAQRAGTDPELKSVMKIVARGEASPEQLEFFQGHINGLTKILEAQKAAQAKQAAAAPPAPAPPPPRPTPAPVPVAQATPTRPSPATPAISSPAAVPSAYTPQTPYNAYGTPQAPHNSPYGPPAQPQKPTLRPIVFEFHENNADKLYFPEHSILEFLPGGRQLRASFLVTKTQEQLDAAKKGSAEPTPTPKPTKAAPKGALAAANGANSTSPNNTANAIKDQEKVEKEEPKVVLYQPVTALVAANDPRVIEWFARAVHTPEVVEKYMNEVFDTAKPAEESYLALRLPRDAAVGERGRDRTASPQTPVVEARPERKKMPVGRPRKVSLPQ
ncbi:uncharacterized protein BDZ99DRAFT_458946 [Mytilinidion resinicola]|uniref:SWR1-complex protein 3 domain-containing protein n=1 Tax=Mytilinidion resinicola TaxID=574789 RepID=A0A6A6Z3Y0_9PEZI|nr:uncharacterized protein BDZ99DRAFT_458946 [Mytilinidion resinicola]KAF2814994.1 hypothetical protein BDZ99DRAFT_458946 [Mytilinidion resinicola]